MHDNIVEEPSGNSTEFGISGFIALICWLALAGEPTDKFQYTPEKRPTPIATKCAHRDLIDIQNYQMTNSVKTLQRSN